MTYLWLLRSMGLVYVCLHLPKRWSTIHGTGLYLPYMFMVDLLWFSCRHTYTRQPWMRHGWHLAVAFFSLPKVEEDGSARHKKKCPPSPVWETQILSVELFVQMLGEEGWGGVEAKIYCSCKFKSYICFLLKKNIMSEGKPEGLGKKRYTSRNSIFFIVLCRQLRGLCML